MFYVAWTYHAGGRNSRDEKSAKYERGVDIMRRGRPEKSG